MCETVCDDPDGFKHAFKVIRLDNLLFAIKTRKTYLILFDYDTCGATVKLL